MVNKLAIKKIWVVWAVFALLIAWGVYLRVDLYLFNRSIWYDEAALWANVRHSGFLELFETLQYNQGAPIGFLLEVKTLIKLFGDSEYVLRFIPLLGGLCSIFAFWWFSSYFLKGHFSKLLGMLVFATSTNLIYYSQEFKQYSTDVLIAMLLVALAMELKLKRPFILGIFSALCLWYSHPAILVCAGVWVALLTRTIKLKNYKNFGIFSIIIALNTLLCYIFSLKQLEGHDYLQNIWATSFIDKNLGNLFDLILNNFYYIFQPIKLFPPEHAIWTPIVITILCIFGGFLLWKQSKGTRFRFWLLILPYVMTLLAAYFHLYPYYDRVTLFLTPFFIVLLVKCSEKLDKFPKTSLAILIIAVLLFINPVQEAQKRMKSMPQQDRGIFKELMQKYSKGDIVLLNQYSALSFKYYQERYKFRALVAKEKNYKNQYEYVQFLLSLKKDHAYWFYTTNMFERFDTKELIEFWGRDKKEFYHYNMRKSDLYYVRN